jgi:hypothetical protein
MQLSLDQLIVWFWIYHGSISVDHKPPQPQRNWLKELTLKTVLKIFVVEQYTSKSVAQTLKTGTELQKNNQILVKI